MWAFLCVWSAARAGRPRSYVPLFAAVVLLACAPGVPRIDGQPAVSPGRSEPWRVPESARTPAPPPEPPASPAASAALKSDSSREVRDEQLSLADVVDLALKNNPATRESWAAASAAANTYGAARGELFPNINGTVSLSRTSASGGSSTGFGVGPVGTGVDSTGNRGNTGSGSATRSQLTPSISLSYLVFDLGGRAGTIETAKQRAIAASLVHNATIQDVVLQVESALFSLLATRALRDAQIVAVQEATADTTAAEARFRVGVGTLQEVLQTRTALAQARFQLATAEGSLLSARGNLAAAMGLNANTRFDVPSLPASDSVTMIAASIDTLINRAITARPELAESRAEANALAAQVRVARSAGYPALTLSATSSFPHTFQGASTTGRNSSLVLGLQIPIFNGFARQYDVRAARDEYDAGLARVESTRQRITVEVFTAYSALQTATQRVQASIELLASAQQSADVAQGRYREGVGTIIDVLLARTSLVTARSESIQARWEWRTALAQLAHDIGALDVTGRPNLPGTPP